VTDQGGARLIVPLMAVAVSIVLVGHTVEPTKASKLDPHVGDAQILLGGIAATVILTLLAMAGDVGATFAKGVAAITLLSSVVIYGGPLSAHLQSAVAPQVAKNAKAAKPTTPTKG
jgi:hypothetical protein